MSTPEEIKKHSSKFIYGSWRNYTFQELGNFVHLLTKRAHHRTERDKAEKDLDDARNYLVMMLSKLDEHQSEILNKF